MTNEIPKYSLPEIERRWLVDVDLLPTLTGIPFRQIEDKYLHQGRLRLRKVETPGSETVFKLGKKYPSPSGSPENVVSVYLSAAEFDALNALPGRIARKRRRSVLGGALDLYEHPSGCVTIFEVEFPTITACRTYRPPPFATEEVTGNARYTGFALAAEC